MSERDEPGLDELERRLDAAFQATRPRRGFEDELWARLQARRPWWRRLGAALRGVPLAGVATGVAGLLLVGLVVTVVRSGALHVGDVGAPAASTGAAAPAASAPQPARPQAGGAAAAAASPFGPLPAPPGAGAVQVQQAAGPSALPVGNQRVAVEAGTVPAVSPSLAVYRFDPATGPPAGTILSPDQVPSGLTRGDYPSRSAADAVAGAANAGSSRAVVLTVARLVYVAVVSNGAGYLEPAYFYTGTAGGEPVQLLVPALAPSAFQ